MRLDFNYIEEKAQGILLDNNLFEPNFDIKKLAKKIGILLKEEDLGDDVSGFFVMTPQGLPVITYKKEGGKRFRFTIAHEIGHFMLHAKEQPVFVDKKPVMLFRNTASSTGEVLKEREANAFAAALLMPKDLIYKEIDKLEDNLFIEDAISALAKTFGVSEQAMSFRLSNLGYGIG